MTINLDGIKQNIEDVKKRVEAAAIKSGRRLEDIKIIAVTKYVNVERIREAIDCGILDLGENRVQEIREKYDIIDRNCYFHCIGHLQTNKVKYIVDKVQMIHSVDSMELCEEIQKRAEKIGRIIDVLVQVNAAKEESKFGISLESVSEFMQKASKFNNIKVRGLMTIAPYVDDPEEIRWVFREIREKSIDLKKENINNIHMDFLSMGMSNDFEVAIEEGSNVVRIGTAIFGERNY